MRFRSPLHMRAARTLLLSVIGVLTLGVATYGVTHRSVTASSVVTEIPATIAFPVVDATTHQVFGVGVHNVVVLDELTGRVHPLLTLGKRHGPEFLAVDPRSDHLLVSDLRFDHIAKNPRASWFTNLAYVIDVPTDRVIRIVQVHRHIPLLYLLPGEPAGVVAVDSALHHGFVIDPQGDGIMLDMRTGVVLARFRVDPPPSAATRKAMVAVDMKTHRLFIGSDETMATNQLLVAVVDTQTGRVIHWMHRKQPYVQALAAAPTAGHVFVLTPTGQVYVLDAASGRVLRSHRLGSFGFDMIADTQSGRTFVVATVYTHTSAYIHGALVVLGNKIGRVLRTIGFSGGVSHTNGGASAVALENARLAVDPGANRIFFNSGIGCKIEVYNGYTGAHLGTLHPPCSGYYGMAMDSVTHRLFLSNPKRLVVLNTLASL